MHRFEVTPSAILYHSPYPFVGYESTSMNPGETTRPVASIFVSPFKGALLINFIVSPSMPIFATAS